MDDRRLVLGRLLLPAGVTARFELRHDRWLADESQGLLRWHDGPLECRDGDTLLLVAKDMGAAVVLQGLDPSSVRAGSRGPGVLLQAGRDEYASSGIEWEVREVVEAPP